MNILYQDPEALPGKGSKRRDVAYLHNPGQPSRTCTAKKDFLAGHYKWHKPDYDFKIKLEYLGVEDSTPSSGDFELGDHDVQVLDDYITPVDSVSTAMN